MSAPLSGTDKNDVETGGALGKRSVLSQKNLRCERYARLLTRRHGKGSLIMRLALLDFHKGKMIAALSDEIDLSRLGFVAVGDNTIALAFKEFAGTLLCG